VQSNLRGVISTVISTRAIIINPENKILLIRRSIKNKTNVGKWEFVGGKMEQHQNINETLKREVLEETNIKIENTKTSVCAVSNNKINIPGYENIMHISISKIIKLNNTPEVTLSHEHDKFIWATKDEALNMDLRGEAREALLLPSFI
jgi:8-oxo-dGTP diphosphatase